jgi:hypothetical protein
MYVPSQLNTTCSNYNLVQKEYVQYLTRKPVSKCPLTIYKFITATVKLHFAIEKSYRYIAISRKKNYFIIVLPVSNGSFVQDG